MRGVGHHECGILDGIAHGAVRTIYWDMQVRVTTRIDHMSWMVSTIQVINCDMFIHETSKGLASVGNVQDIDRESSRTVHVTLGLDQGKFGEREATLTIGLGVVLFLCVGIVVHHVES